MSNNPITARNTTTHNFISIFNKNPFYQQYSVRFVTSAILASMVWIRWISRFFYSCVGENGRVCGKDSLCNRILVFRIDNQGSGS